MITIDTTVIFDTWDLQRQCLVSISFTSGGCPIVDANSHGSRDGGGILLHRSSQCKSHQVHFRSKIFIHKEAGLFKFDQSIDLRTVKIRRN